MKEFFRSPLNDKPSFPKLIFIFLSFSLTLGGIYLIFLGLAGSKLAPTPPTPESIEGKTIRVLKLAHKYEKADAGKKKEILPELTALSEGRKSLLLDLYEKDPGKAVSIVLSNDLRKKFPSASSSLIEEEVSVEGSLDVLVAELENEQASYSYFLNDASGNKYTLRFAGEGPKLMSGSRVRVKGHKLDKEIALAKAEGENFQILSEAQTGHTVKKVAVILINFQDNVIQPYDKAFAQGVTFTNASSAKTYYNEASFGQLILEGKYSTSGDVYGWYTIPHAGTTCDYSTWATAAKNAATNSGVDISGYDNFIYAFPKTSACSWWGLGTIGGAPSSAWVNGTYATQVVSHELGHNYGVHHASTYTCTNSSGVKVTISTSCSIGEYGDPFDVMAKNTKHMSTFQKGRLNWYGAANMQTVTGNGSYTIAPIETSSGAVQALKIPLGLDSTTGKDSFYYVEYRQPYGYDNFDPAAPVVNGVSVRLAPEYTEPRQTLLLDMTPETATFLDSALAVGKTFNDSIKGITITTTEKSSTSATVSVSFAIAPCTKANPSISISPASQWGTAGQALNYNVTVKNNNGPTCAPNTYNVSRIVPSGWFLYPSAYNVTLAPGASSTQAVSITSPVGTADNFYQFGEKVMDTSDYSYTATASANYNVFTPDISLPQVSITSPVNNQTVFGDTMVSVSATDNVGIVKTELFADGVIYGSDTAAPYQYTLKTSSLSNGLHTIYARAYDDAGNAANSSLVNLNVSNVTTDTISPTVSFSSPVNNSTVSGKVSVNIAASDNVGVSKVNLFIDGTLVKTFTSSPYAVIWNTRAKSVVKGTHVLKAVVYDAAGNWREASITVIVSK